MADMFPIPLDANDAMTIVIVVTEKFISLPWDTLNYGQRTGAILLYEALLHDVVPLLPQTPDMAHVHALTARAGEVARSVRMMQKEVS